MKRQYILIFLFITGFNLILQFISSAQVSDDPFEKLKQLATTQRVQKQLFPSKVVIRDSDPSFKVLKKAPRNFTPFPMVDVNGKPVAPTEYITIASTKNKERKILAGEYYKQLNELERSLNEKGYTLRDQKNVLKSEILKNKKLYDDKIHLMPKSVGPYLSEKQIEKYLTPTIKVGEIVLKPVGKYSAAEKEKIKKLYFSSDNRGLKASTIPPTGYKHSTGIPALPRIAKELNYDFSKSWPSDGSFLGDPNKFAVAASVGFGLHVKQYTRCDPTIDPSVYSAYANCLARGSLFGNAFDIMKVDANITMPAKVTANSSVNFVVEVAGINIVNEHNDASTFETRFSTNPSVLNIDKSLQISIPIAGPITFEGSVGVRGHAGIDYSFSVDKLTLGLKVYPNAGISGYAEAGIGFLIGEIGVGAELNFLSVSFPLNGIIGVVVNNEGQMVIATIYNCGYDIKELDGRLYVYADGCFFKCWRIAEVDIFKWDGFVQRGTFAQDAKFTPIQID